MDSDSPQDVQHPTNFNPMDTGSYPFEMNFGSRDEEAIHAVDMGCCPFEMNFTKQPLQQPNQTNGSIRLDTENFIYDKSTNGKHENGSANYDNDDDDDDDDDDEDDDEDVDLGPETDVDAVDDASVPFEKISRQLFPEKSTNENDDDNDDVKMEKLDDSQNSNDSKSRQHELLPEADNVADSEDSEDEWNYYRVKPDKDKDSPVQVNETSSESKEKDAASPKPLIEDESESENSKGEANFTSKIETEPKSPSSEPLNTECNVETEKSNEEVITGEKEESEDYEDKMDFSLNPDAKEFIPPSMAYSQRQIIQDYPISGSPLKQAPQVMDNIDIPSEEEFEKGFSERPQDIEGGAASPLSKPLESLLDDSEISSTKAEFGDESTTSFLTTTSDFPRTEVSAMDYSFVSADRGEYDIAKDPMAMSYTPDDFQAAFEKDEDENQLDLNAVHDLTDVDFSDNVNGYENDVTENSDDSGEKKEISSSPFVEESEAQASLNPYNMDTLKETLNEENMRSVKYSETSTDNVDDTCLIDTKVPSSEDSQKWSESDNSQYRDFPFESKIDNHSEVVEEKEEIHQNSENSYHNDHFEQKENLFLKEENHFDNEVNQYENEKKNNIENSETHFENNENIFEKKENQECFIENKEELLENKEILSENEEILIENKEIPIIENKEILFDNKEMENKEILLEKNDVNSPETERPDFEPEIQDFEFDPEIQEKSQTQFELSLEEDHLQNDLGKFDDVKSNQIESEIVDMDKDFEQKTNYAPILNLSESLQEFTGLERQINETKDLENIEYARVTEAAISKENIVVEQKETVNEENLVNLESLKIEEPKSETPAVETTPAAAAIAGAAVAATAAAAVATKKATATKASTTKTTSSKAPTKSVPTSPTKTARTITASATAKKPTTGTVSRPKQLDTKQTTSNSASKSSAFKAAPVPKTSSTAPKITPRLTTTTAAKPKNLISSPKPTAAGDKKTTLNGDVKTLASKATAPKSTTLKATTTNSLTKTTLVKSSSATRTSTSAAAPPKPKPGAIGATAKVSSTAPRTATATTRPKTAPATTGLSAGTAKSRVSAVKSPMIDKQIKETANKQISSRVSSAPLKTSRVTGTTTSSSSTTVSATTTVKRTSTLKTSTATSPTKKASAPLTKATTKPSSITKTTGKILTKNSKPVPVQNGNCEIKKIENVVTTTMMTTTTTNIEEDVPKKDISPIAPPTDNQLITTE